MAELKLALKNSSLCAVGLAGVVQIVASVVRPVPMRAPAWYSSMISILDVIFLDTGSVINQECLDGDALSSERRILAGTTFCIVLSTIFQVKCLRPENLCLCQRDSSSLSKCCHRACRGRLAKRSSRSSCSSIMRFTITPRIRMVLFYVLSLIYGAAASVSLSMLTCTQSHSSTSSKLRLRSRPDVECYSKSDGTLTLSVLAWILLAVFIIPWPYLSFQLVRRFYWIERRGRSKSISRGKYIVYDYWIADDNNLKPDFFWFRSLDAALLGLSAALTAMFDVSDVHSVHPTFEAEKSIRKDKAMGTAVSVRKSWDRMLGKHFALCEQQYYLSSSNID